MLPPVLPHYTLTCGSIDVDVGYINGCVALRLGRLVQPPLGLRRDGDTRLAGLTGSVLVVGNHSELVGRTGLQCSNGEGTSWLLDDGLPTRETGLEHLQLV